MLIQGRPDGGEHQQQSEEKGNEMALSSGEDRKELKVWKVQLALKIAAKPRTVDTEQKQIIYAFGRFGEGGPCTNHAILRQRIWPSQIRFLENTERDARIGVRGRRQGSNGETGTAET
jgi:hypothetical protein